MVYSHLGITATPARPVLSWSCADLVRRARARVLLGLRISNLRRGRLGAHSDRMRAAAGQPRARRVAGMRARAGKHDCCLAL